MPLFLSCIPHGPWLILWKIMATVVFPRNPSSSTQHSPHMAMAGPDCLFNTSTPTTSALIDPIGIAWINCCAKVLQLKCDKSGWFQIYQMTQTTSPRTSSAMDGSGCGLYTFHEITGGSDHSLCILGYNGWVAWMRDYKRRQLHEQDYIILHPVGDCVMADKVSGCSNVQRVPTLHPLEHCYCVCEYIEWILPHNKRLAEKVGGNKSNKVIKLDTNSRTLLGHLEETSHLWIKGCGLGITLFTPPSSSLSKAVLKKVHCSTSNSSGIAFISGVMSCLWYVS